MDDISGSDIESKSRVFVDSLEITSLGAFSVGSHALRLADTVKRHHLATINAIDIIDPVWEGSRWKLNDWTTTSDFTVDDIYAELHFWWRRYGDPDMMQYASLQRDDYEVATHSRLHKVLLRPEFYTYFAAGIWDEDFIAKCRAENIDADLASSMMKEASR